MVAFLRKVLASRIGFGEKRTVGRRQRISEQEILKILGRDQLERLKRKGLSIPVVT